MNRDDVVSLLKGILEGVNIHSDVTYQQACQQIRNSMLPSLQKELIIAQLTNEYQERKKFIVGRKFILELSRFF